MSTTTNQKLSIKQLQIVFGISHMTAYAWRQGTTTKDPLPAAPLTKTEEAMTRPPITFTVKAVRAWAKKNGVPFAKDPEVVLAQKSGPGKSGPKAKTKPAATTKVPAKKAAVKKTKTSGKVVSITAAVGRKAKAPATPTEDPVAASV